MVIVMTDQSRGYSTAFGNTPWIYLIVLSLALTKQTNRKKCDFMVGLLQYEAKRLWSISVNSASIDREFGEEIEQAINDFWRWNQW